MLRYSRTLFQKQNNFLFKNNQSQLYSPLTVNYFSSQQQEKKQGFITRFFDKDAAVAPADSNRWLKMVPAALCHLCIGGPYAWSVMASALTKEYGVVASSALDWTLSQSTFALSLTFIMQGVSAAVAGGLQIKYGLRKSMYVASAFYASGVLLGAAGIYMHSLPLLYFGYGFLAGTGVGTVYTPPIQALMEWFPDRKGLASGVCIAGFGSGALIMAPYVQHMMQKFQKIPDYVGKLGSVETYMEQGRMFAKIGGEAKEVVLATAADLSKLPGGGAGLEEGLYLVGTGNTGAAAALGSLGLIYTGVLLASSYFIKRPNGQVQIPGFDYSKLGSAAVQSNVHHSVVMKTPQFWTFMTFLCAIASGGIGVMSVSKSMMMDQFSVLLPSVVTTTFATSFVLMLSAGNMFGRLGWTQIFDLKGGKFVYNSMGALAIPAYLSLPFFIGQVVNNPTVLPLYGFIGSTVLIISIMGGVYASLPAYEAQLFGTKYVGAIHGKMLLGSSFSALVGPNLLIQMRNYEESKAIANLLQQSDPVKFQETFQVGIDRAQELIDAKSLTINKLMQTVPPEIKDPSPYLYDSAMYTLAGFMGVAAIAHSRLKPVDPKYFEKLEQEHKLNIQNEQQEKQSEEVKEELNEEENEKYQKDQKKQQ